MRFFLAGAALFLAATFSAAAEQPPQPEDQWKTDEFQAIGIRAGAVYPAGGLGAKPGRVYGAHVLYHWSPRLGMGYEVDYMDFRPDTDRRPPSKPVALARSDISMVVTARWSPVLRKWASPLFIAGGGMHYYEAAQAFSPTNIRKSFGLRGAGVFGAGMTGWVVDSFVWEVAGRWHFLPEPKSFRADDSSNPGQAFTVGLLLAVEI